VADLSITRTIKDIQDALSHSVKKREEILFSLLDNEKISLDTYDSMEKRIKHLSTGIATLKEIMEEEESFWRSISTQKVRVLESILAELNYSYLFGDISDDDWKQKSMIINLGLNSLRNPNSKPSLPLQNPGVERIVPQTPESVKKKDSEIKRSKNKPKKQNKKEPPSFGLQCMNPWKPRCRNKDIELSIYHNGQLRSICQQCWEDISKKSVEWSGLTKTS
jgi:hypothetical protein